MVLSGHGLYDNGPAHGVAQEKDGQARIFLRDEPDQGFQVQGHGFGGAPAAPYRCIAEAALVISVYRYVAGVEIEGTAFDEVGIIVEAVHCNEDEPCRIHAARRQPCLQVQLGPVKGDKGCLVQLRLGQRRVVRRGKIGGTG